MEKVSITDLFYLNQYWLEKYKAFNSDYIKYETESEKVRATAMANVSAINVEIERRTPGIIAGFEKK